ncbi:MAG: hypothetical protein ACREUD_00615 [Gammaproteobacteria bacterium]
MNKKERGELMNKRALELARSGEHEDYVTIEITLRGEGFSEARQWLDNRFLRKEINEMCRQARTSKSGK